MRFCFDKRFWWQQCCCVSCLGCKVLVIQTCNCAILHNLPDMHLRGMLCDCQWNPKIDHIVGWFADCFSVGGNNFYTIPKIIFKMFIRVLSANADYLFRVDLQLCAVACKHSDLKFACLSFTLESHIFSFTLTLTFIHDCSRIWGQSNTLYNNLIRLSTF